MRFRRDDAAASPLVVLTTFVLVAVAVTVAAYALLVDRPEPELAVTPVHEDGTLAFFDVTRTGGDLEWGDLEVRFTDRGNVDVTDTYLRVPTGEVGRDDRIEVSPVPPAGTYLLQVFLAGDELVRLAVTV